MNRPVVAGVAGGVGTSTVAAAVGADDLGVYSADRHAGPVDVLVCRSTVDSVERAHRVVADVVAAAASKPVLVVVADAPRRSPRGVRVLIAMVLPHTTAVIEVPFVLAWRAERCPLAQAGAALSGHGDRDLVPFARAMRNLASLLDEQRPVAARVVPDSALRTGTPREDEVDVRELETRRQVPEGPIHGEPDAPGGEAQLPGRAAPDP